MDSYVCVRVTYTGYDRVWIIMDIAFGDTPEEALSADPWHSDMLRVRLSKSTQLYIATEYNQKDTLFVLDTEWMDVIEKEGKRTFKIISPLDEHRLIDAKTWTSAEGHDTYMILCPPLIHYHARHAEILSMNRDSSEEIKEIKMSIGPSILDLLLSSLKQ